MQRRNKAAAPARPSSPSHGLSGAHPLEIKSPPSSGSMSGKPSGPISGITIPSGVSTAHIPMATVVRHTCGTGPFDKMWLNTDCCGLICAMLTYGLHLFGCYAVTTIILPPWMSYPDNEGEVVIEDSASKLSVMSAGRHLSFWGKFHSFTFVLIAVLAVASHFKAMTTDPGAVPPDAEPVPDICRTIDDKHSLTEPLVNVSSSASSKRPKRICRRCNAYKPDRAHHCSICKRCIIKMDHHCPWVNNCVGIGNHKFFLLFIFYTFLSCIYAMALVIARFVQCIGKIEHHQPCLDQPEHLVGIIGLCVESLLFGMFTCCMIVDQWDVVSTNVTHIDRLKGETSTEDLEGSSGVSEVFGGGNRDANANGKGKKRHMNMGGFRPDWLSPFAKVCFPDNIRDDIMGFCRPCGFRGKKDKVEDGGNISSAGSGSGGSGSGSGSSSNGNSPNTGKVAEIV